METINKPDAFIKTLDKWLGRIVDSHEQCKYCGKLKKDYINPETGELTPLKCMCDKELENLIDARDGILKAQVNVQEKYNYNPKKYSEEDKRFMKASNDNLDKLNNSIDQFMGQAQRK